MMRSFLMLFLIITSFSLSAKDLIKLEISATEDNQGKACNIAFGKYRRELKVVCVKKKMKVNYDTLVISKCIQKKIADKKYKATYKIKYNCK